MRPNCWAILAQVNRVEAKISSVAGVVSYSIVRAANRCIFINVGEDKVGADESVQVAGEFARDNWTPQATPPTASEGETIIHFRP